MAADLTERKTTQRLQSSNLPGKLPGLDSEIHIFIFLKARTFNEIVFYFNCFSAKQNMKSSSMNQKSWPVYDVKALSGHDFEDFIGFDVSDQLFSIFSIRFLLDRTANSLTVIEITLKILIFH